MYSTSIHFFRNNQEIEDTSLRISVSFAAIRTGRMGWMSQGKWKETKQQPCTCYQVYSRNKDKFSHLLLMTFEAMGTSLKQDKVPGAVHREEKYLLFDPRSVPFFFEAKLVKPVN